MRVYCEVIAVAVAISAAGTSVAQDEPGEFGPTDPPSIDEHSGQSDQEQVYTWEDGDRTVRVLLQSDLEVSEDGDIARGSGEHIVTKASVGGSTGQPVFRSESSGTLMTLPGGVLLVLDAAWSTAETNAFFRPQPDRAGPGVGHEYRRQQFLRRDRAGLSVAGLGQRPGRTGWGTHLQPQLVERTHPPVSDCPQAMRYVGLSCRSTPPALRVLSRAVRSCRAGDNPPRPSATPPRRGIAPIPSREGCRASGGVGFFCMTR